jgi:hypothetical protein
VNNAIVEGPSETTFLTSGECPSTVTRDVILDDQWPMACTVLNTLYFMCWKVLNHSPYSADLLPRNFHVFVLPPPNKALKDIKAAVMQWFQQQSRELFVKEIHQLVHQYDACLKCPWEQFLTASTPLSRIIPEQILTTVIFWKFFLELLKELRLCPAK